MDGVERIRHRVDGIFTRVLINLFGEGRVMNEFEKRGANSLSLMNWWLYCIFVALCMIAAALGWK